MEISNAVIFFLIFLFYEKNLLALRSVLLMDSACQMSSVNNRRLCRFFRSLYKKLFHTVVWSGKTPFVWEKRAVHSLKECSKWWVTSWCLILSTLDMDAFFFCVFCGFPLPHILIHDLTLAFNRGGPYAFGYLPPVFKNELQWKAEFLLELLQKRGRQEFLVLVRRPVLDFKNSAACGWSNVWL